MNATCVEYTVSKSPAIHEKDFGKGLAVNNGSSLCVYTLSEIGAVEVSKTQRWSVYDATDFIFVAFFIAEKYKKN